MQLQNKVSVVGIGPGNRDYLTEKAEKELKKSDIIIGYKSYIKFIEDIFPDKKYLKGRMGGEVERVKKALKKSENNRVSLVCGGDPNIYALAGLTLEIANKQEFDTKIEIIPGITAMSALGMKFSNLYQNKIALISLSDYLSSWKNIKERIEFATKKNCNLVFYNPKSKNRPDKLKKIIKYLLNHRSEDNEVIIGHQLTRKGEWVEKTNLKNVLEPSIYQKINMGSLVVVTSPNLEVKEYDNSDKIKIIGIGPGSLENLTKRIQEDIKYSKNVFGAEKYLNQLNSVLNNKKTIKHENLPYKERTQRRIKEARKKEGRSVILAAGDPSIYGPKPKESNEWFPKKEAGVSSYQALAAKAGAPLVNDFLITSSTEENHLNTIKKALNSNLAIVSFNTNKKSLNDLKALLKDQKPIIVGKNVNRKNEEIFIGYVKDLKVEKLSSGSNWTSIIPNKDSFYWEKNNFLITKRGYEEKYEY